MKIFEVAEGTPGYLMDRSGFYRPFTTRKDLVFEMENIAVDPFHPEDLGINTIGHDFATKGYYGFTDEMGNARYRAKYILFVAASKVKVV
jgi:hypothetical protein